MQTTDSIRVYKALADEMRLAIVRCLARSKVALKSCDVVKSCTSCGELSQPAMSHHFKKLVDSGVVITKKLGTENMYELDRLVLARAGINADKI